MGHCGAGAGRVPSAVAADCGGRMRRLACTRERGARADAVARWPRVPGQHVHAGRSDRSFGGGRAGRGLRRHLGVARQLPGFSRRDPGPALRLERIGRGSGVPGQQRHDARAAQSIRRDRCERSLRRRVGEPRAGRHRFERSQHPGSALRRERIGRGSAVPGQHLRGERSAIPSRSDRCGGEPRRRVGGRGEHRGPALRLERIGRGSAVPGQHLRGERPAIPIRSGRCGGGLRRRMGGRGEHPGPALRLEGNGRGSAVPGRHLRGERPA